MQAHRLFPLALLCLALLTACGGGGGGMHVQPAPPNFTSVPPTAATQDAAYTYQIAATDPSGGSVTFSLSASPTGAALSGSVLSWTPTGAQSRIPNSFSVTGTTTSGGTATQTWSVNPNGTITVNSIDTDWMENGPVQTPVESGLGLFALVPQPDGSLLTLQGTYVAPGVGNILNVPAGYFWLTAGPLQFGGIWTSSSTIDLGRDLLGTATAGPASQNTTFDFNLTGLDPVTSAGWLVGFTDTFEPLGALPVPANSTALTGSSIVAEGPDWSLIDTAFLLQYEPVSVGPLNTLALGPELTVSGLSLTNGATNNITGTLQASSLVSMSLSVPGSQWAAPLGGVGPTPGTLESSSLSVVAEPYITGRNATPSLFGPNFPMVAPISGDLPPLTISADWCLNANSLAIGFLPVNEPPVVSDTTFGTLQYQDPFPSDWTRAVAFCQQALVPITVPGLDFPFPFALLYGEAVPPATSLGPLAPLTGPVQNPTVNGASLFTAATLNTTAVSLSWAAPAGTTPAGYEVTPFKVTTNGSGIGLSSSGSFRTAKTSVTLPPLTAGNTYLFVITTTVDAATNFETSPYRSALPSAFAQVVSAPITISADATTPVMRGDAAAIKRLLQARSAHTETRQFPNPAQNSGGNRSK